MILAGSILLLKRGARRLFETRVWLGFMFEMKHGFGYDPRLNWDAGLAVIAFEMKRGSDWDPCLRWDADLTVICIWIEMRVWLRSVFTIGYKVRLCIENANLVLKWDLCLRTYLQWFLDSLQNSFQSFRNSAVDWDGFQNTLDFTLIWALMIGLAIFWDVLSFDLV